MAKEKIQITMESEVLAALDQYAEDMYMSRSGVIQSAIVEVLTRRDLVESISNLSIALKIAVEKNEIDPDTMRKISNFEALAGLLVNK